MVSLPSLALPFQATSMPHVAGACASCPHSKQNRCWQSQSTPTFVGPGEICTQSVGQSREWCGCAIKFAGHQMVVWVGGHLDRSAAPGGRAPGQERMVIHIGTEEEAHVFVKHLRCDQLHNMARFVNVRKSHVHIWATLRVSCVVCRASTNLFHSGFVDAHIALVSHAGEVARFLALNAAQPECPAIQENGAL